MKLCTCLLCKQSEVAARRTGAEGGRMKRYCKCVGWSEKYQCRDGIARNADGEQYQAHPSGRVCRCTGDCHGDYHARMVAVGYITEGEIDE